MSDPLPFGVTHLGHRGDRDHAGIGDHHVEPAKAGQGIGDGCFDGLDENVLVDVSGDINAAGVFDGLRLSVDLLAWRKATNGTGDLRTFQDDVTQPAF